MNNINLIPRLAVNGIRRNLSLYAPYLLVTSLCASVFYIFVSIQQNTIMETVPHASYVMQIMIIGELLLGIILTPFLISINRFLMKRRKTEIGLYSVLGMEKKHIAMMQLVESLLLYIVAMAIGVLIATVFSKLIFLFLLKITHLPSTTQFSFSSKALLSTLIFFGVIAGINLVANVARVSLENPSELFQSSKQGEKEPKRLWILTVIGLLFLAAGFFLALTSEMDSTIFTYFFLSIFFIIAATYLLFMSGSIAILRICRRNKKFFYKSKNFVTVSGLLYRMKKNAAGLANICIFSTMTIITLMCTGSVFFGQNDAIEFKYPMDCEFEFFDNGSDAEEFEQIAYRTADEYGVTIKDMTDFSYVEINTLYDRNITFSSAIGAEPAGRTVSVLMTLGDYNRTQNKNVVLNDNEVLTFNSSSDFGHDSVIFGDTEYSIKEELQQVSFSGKNERYMGYSPYHFIMKDQAAIDSVLNDFDTVDDNGFIHHFCFNADGEKSEDFTHALYEKVHTSPSFYMSGNRFDWTHESYSIIGGLLFLGIFFGLIFMMCLVLMMYYKQISEGFEDKKNFEIMQKVGMDDKEVRRTISRQILIVFFLPLITAMIYTVVSVNIVGNLMATIQIFSTPLFFVCAGITALVFAVLYAISYAVTAKAYYRIVRKPVK